MMDSAVSFLARRSGPSCTMPPASMFQRRKAKRAGQRQAVIGTCLIHLSHQRSQASALPLSKRFQFRPEGSFQRDRSRMAGKSKGTLRQVTRHGFSQCIGVNAYSNILSKRPANTETLHNILLPLSNPGEAKDEA